MHSATEKNRSLHFYFSGILDLQNIFARMPSMTLQRKFLFSLLIVGVLSTFSIIFGQFYYLEDVLTKERVQEIEQLAKEQIRETASTFRYYTSFAKILSDYQEVETYLTDQTEENRRYVDSIFGKYADEDPEILSLYLLDVHGLTLVSTDRSFIGNNYSFRDYFKNSIKGRAYLDAVVGVTSDEFGYYFSQPVHSSNGLVNGVLVVKIGGYSINESLFNNDWSVENTLMLVDEVGVVMASNVPDRFLHSLGPLSPEEKQKFLVSQKFSNRDIPPLHYSVMRDLILDYTRPISQRIYDRVDNTEENIYIEKVKDTPFYLVTEIQIGHIRESVFGLTTFIGLLIVLAFLFIAIVIYRLIRLLVINPLNRFKTTTERIGAGDFGSQVDIKTDDEFGDVAKAINWMSDKLKNYYGELNKEVKQKTSELIERNKVAEGQQETILSVLKDVQEEKERTEDLAGDLEKFKLVVDNVSDHVVITDSEGIVLYGNKSIERITGYSLGEVLGKKSGKLWSSPMTKEYYDQFWNTIKVQKTTFKGEVINKRKNGELYTAEIEVSPILDKENNVKYFLGIERDISERKNSEEQIKKVLSDLEEKTQRLASDKIQNEALFANIGDGIISTNQDGLVEMVNDSALNMLGLHRTEVIGQPILKVFELVDDQDRPISDEDRPVAIALATGSKTTIPLGKTFFYKRRDGKRFPVNMTVTPYILNNQIRGVVEVFRDVTLEKDVDRMKTEFVSLASHQLRTPLSTINWYAEMLLTGDVGPLNPDQKKFVEEIYVGNQRMVDLVNSLLNVSRIEMGTFVVDPEPVDVEAVVHSIFDELKPIVIQKQIELSAQFDPSVKIMPLDAKLFRIVLQNLLTNAVKYTKEKGSVVLTTKKQKKDFLVTVKDTGMGIPQKDQNKIFTKMFRADNAKMSDTGGTGLGLYIIKSIIEQTANGKIWFESVENEGTTFFVSIPNAGMIKKEGSKALS